MKLPVGKIEKCCSSEAGRYSMQNVLLNAEKSRLEATNGRVLACVPIKLDEGDKTTQITREVVSATRKTKSRDLFCKEDGLHVKETRVVYPKPDSEFPKTELVIAPALAREYLPAIRLNAEYLFAIAQAITNDPKCPTIAIFVPKDDEKGEKPIWIQASIEDEKPSDQIPFGLLMPLSSEY